MEYLFERFELAPKKFGFNCDKNLEFSSVNVTSNFCNADELLNHFCFRKAELMFIFDEIRYPAGFSEKQLRATSHQVPNIFCYLNIQLENPNRTQKTTLLNTVQKLEEFFKGTKKTVNSLVKFL